MVEVEETTGFPLALLNDVWKVYTLHMIFLCSV